MKNTAWHSMAAAVCTAWALALAPALAGMEKADGLMWSYAQDGEEGGEGGGDGPPDDPRWTYTLSGGMAIITSARVEGDVVIPSVLGGCPVGAMEAEAFSSCGAMTSVVIPDSVSNLWMWTFAGATGLVSATLPATLSGLEPQAFDGCNALASFSISPDAADYAVRDGVLFSKDMKTLCCFPPGKAGAYAIPEGTETVADFAFGAANGSVTSLTIPPTVTYLGNFSLCCSRVATLTVPESVTGIGAGVFGWCSGLKTLYLPSSWQSTTMLDDSGGVAPGCTVVYYPTAAERRYADWLETLGQTADSLPSDGDADLDGASNWEECVAGTDPFDPAERFEARILARDGKMVVEPSTTESGRVYRVHGTTNLLGSTETPPVWEDVTGEPELPAGDWRFFRVGVDFAE